MKIAFISCVSSKQKTICKAKDMYISTLFKNAWKYANDVIKADKIYILSAEHHLLDPNKEIKPYNNTLNNKPVLERKKWAEIVRKQIINENIDLNNDQIYVLAGKKYHEYVFDKSNTSNNIHYPYFGCKGIGYILNFLKTEINK